MCGQDHFFPVAPKNCEKENKSRKKKLKHKKFEPWFYITSAKHNRINYFLLQKRRKNLPVAHNSLDRIEQKESRWFKLMRMRSIIQWIKKYTKSLWALRNCKRLQTSKAMLQHTDEGEARSHHISLRGNKSSTWVDYMAHQWTREKFNHIMIRMDT